MRKTIGILAHVDAGKTTFSEQLLYHTGSIRNLGRVDEKTSTLDHNEIEQNRGITIFSGQGNFTYHGDTYYLIDTPGHTDFAAETERAISILDYAIVLISGSSGVQAHTVNLFHLLKLYQIPAFFFINKMDMEGIDLDAVFQEIQNKLTKDALNITSIPVYSPAVAEFIADREDAFMETYLNEVVTDEIQKRALTALIKSQHCYPVLCGSALKNKGVDQFLNVFSSYTETDYEATENIITENKIIEDDASKDDSMEVVTTEYDTSKNTIMSADSLKDSTMKYDTKNELFIGKVYKITHEENGNRITYLKALKGKLEIKTEFTFDQGGEHITEKINEIRIYNGKKFEVTNTIVAGDVCAVTGLKSAQCGSLLKSGKVNYKEKVNFHLSSGLQSKVHILDDTDLSTCMAKLRILEAEDPMLTVTYQKETEEILLHIMGKIQLEVLTSTLFSRFGIRVEFEKPQIQYKETIGESVVGYGHFEPLRHYAEVQIRIEPNQRGMGITFASECPVDILAANYQSLIETHIFEKVHKGILTGYPLTDVHIVLQSGRAHIKHTEGGDFREATYRAVRQGLEKIPSIVLEPYYQFDIYMDESHIGRVLSDIQKMRGEFEAPEQMGQSVHIHGRGPIETFMEYPLELTSFTRGTGSISLVFDGYDICQNQEEVVERIGYQKDKDTENTSRSVFCAKGTSFTVSWDEAEDYMHTK